MPARPLARGWPCWGSLQSHHEGPLQALCELVQHLCGGPMGAQPLSREGLQRVLVSRKFTKPRPDRTQSEGEQQQAAARGHSGAGDRDVPMLRAMGTLLTGPCSCTAGHLIYKERQ